MIDIRQRRNSKSYKMSEVRECWRTILELFNRDGDTTNRNLKQIQKFWLNSRLRPRSLSMESHTRVGESRTKPSKKIKTETNDGSYQDGEYFSTQSNQSERHDSSVNSKSGDEESFDDQEEDEEHEEDAEETQQADTDSQYDQKQDVYIEEPPPVVKTVHPYNRHHHTKYQKTYTSQTVTQQQHHHHQAPQPIHSITLPMTPTPPPILNNIEIIPAPASQDTYESHIKSLKLSEHKIRLRESQMRLDKQKIDMLRSQEELDHLKEMNRLRVREMQLKIRLLEEQTKTDRK